MRKAVEGPGRRWEARYKVLGGGEEEGKRPWEEVTREVGGPGRR